MKCNNIIYIKDSTILLKRKNKIYKSDINKEILEYGIIKKTDLLESEIIKLYRLNKLSTFFYNQHCLVIFVDYNIGNNYQVIKKIFNELDFNKIDLIADYKTLKMEVGNCYLFNGSEICRLYYFDKFKKLNNIVLDLNKLSTLEFKLLLLNRTKNKNLYLIDYNNSLLTLIEQLGVNYYIYNDKNFIINNISDY